MYNMKKSLLAMVLAALVLLTSLMPAFAEDIPYDTYNYDYWNDIFRTPAAYVPQGTVLGTDLTWEGANLEAFKGPQDMFVAPNGDIYVADTGNNRIVVLDNGLRTVKQVITSFDNAGQADAFNAPTGVCVTEDGWLFVADSQNKRIVALDENCVLQRVVEMPGQAMTQEAGGVQYAVGTYVEGMSALERIAFAADGGSYAVASLPEGSATQVTDEVSNTTYTVVAEAEALQPFENELLTGAVVTGTPVENGEEADVFTLGVAKDGGVQRITAAEVEVADASGTVLARSGYRVLDAQGSLVTRAFDTAEGVALADAQGHVTARVNADGSVSLYGTGDAVIGMLKWNEAGVVFCDAAGAMVASGSADGAVSFYNAEGGAALLLQGCEAGQQLMAGENEVALLKADGSIALRDATGAEAVILTLVDGAVAVTDPQGGEYAWASTKRNVTTIKNEAGDTLTTLDKDGLMALTNAAGDKVGTLGMTEQGFTLANDAKTIAVITADGQVTCVDENGAALAHMGADGSVSIVGGETVLAEADGEGVVLNGFVTVNKDGSIEMGEAEKAVLTRAEGQLRVQEASGAQSVILPSDSISLRALLPYAGVNANIVALQEDGSTVTVKLTGDTCMYIAEPTGLGLTKETMSGEKTSYTNYDPKPNKDLFQLIGNLVNWMRGKPATMTKLDGVKGVWVDEDGSIYAVTDKRATRLNEKGKLEHIFSGYRTEGQTDETTFQNMTEFAVEDGKVYVRDGANKVVVQDLTGHLVQDIASNAVEVRDAQGNVTAVFTEYGEGTAFVGITGIELMGDKLFVGQADGTVVILNLEGETLQVVENDTVVVMNAAGEITGTKTIAKSRDGRSQERFQGLTGVAMLDGKLCVAGANNRILVLDENDVAVHVAQNNCVNVTRDGEVTTITGYTHNGAQVTFPAVNGVEGVALNSVRITVPNEKNPKKPTVLTAQLCIADSSDNLVVFNNDLQVTRVTRDADSEVLAADFDFSPKKVAVDYAGRLYCVVQHKVQGIMVFETNGDFTGFFGTIEVSISAWDKFWRKLATKEERSKQQLFIPTEFTGIDIDEKGFVYATNKDEAGLQAVRRLNPKGEDVIRMGANANLGGDIAINGTTTNSGPSQIVDVVYREKGIYSLLDSKRGRIFTYDHEGNLLYIFGGRGSQTGTFSQQVEAVEYANDRILVLDRAQNSIFIFGETEYGRLINEAVGLRFDGDEAEAVELWEQVLRMDENNELANTGIGKALLSAGRNKEAMEYLKRGMNREYYSVAFKRYRNELLKENIHYVLTGAVVLVAAVIAYVKVIRPRIKNKQGRRA